MPKSKKGKGKEPSAKDGLATLIPQTIKFHNWKGPSYRSIPADGAWGNLNPHGMVHLTFYNERAPIPTESIHAVTPDGKLGPEITEKRVIKEGMIRQLEADVVLSLSAAVQLHGWLTTMLNEAQKNGKFGVQAVENPNG